MCTLPPAGIPLHLYCRFASLLFACRDVKEGLGAAGGGVGGVCERNVQVGQVIRKDKWCSDVGWTEHEAGIESREQDAGLYQLTGDRR